MSLKNKIATSVKQAWPILLALTTLFTIIGAGVKYDSTITKNCKLDIEIARISGFVNARIDASNRNTESLKALLLFKISEDLSNTLTQRSWDISDKYPSGKYPKDVKDELRRLNIEILKVTEDRKHWRKVVLDHPYSSK